MKLLAIESSCDETSAAVMVDGVLKSNIISTQLIHTEWGGVVPELASRAHQKSIIPVVTEALQKANINKNELNAIAFTRGPGLLGALLIGTSFAKSLALSLNIPLIEVNHMQAHVLAHFIENPKPSFPFLCLTVSGGHTQLVWVKSALDMEVIGETQDDAVGEAFDKTAKMLGLPYPGGPQIDRLARGGNPTAFNLPQGLRHSGYFSFSFSGLKTAVRYTLDALPNPLSAPMQADMCASIQAAIVGVLVSKTMAAAAHPDYVSGPGAAFGGRALAPLAFDGRLLGKDFARVRPPRPEFMGLGGMMVPRADLDALLVMLCASESHFINGAVIAADDGFGV